MTTANSPQAFEDAILKGIQQYVREKVEKKYEEMKRVFIQKIDREKEEAVTAIATHISKQVEFERMGNKFVIIVKSNDNTTL